MCITEKKFKSLPYLSAPPEYYYSQKTCLHVCCMLHMTNRLMTTNYSIMESDAFSDSTSSLEDSCESDENENGELFEGCCFKDSFLQLPECFCSEEEVFKEVVCPSTWKTLINSKHAIRLKELLPSFPENDETEKRNTLRKLFNGENFKFGSPFKHFFHRLKDGFLSSEVVEITNALKEANYKEYKNQQKLYSYNLFHDILVSRKRLVDATYSQPPDQVIKMQQFFAKPRDAMLSERTRLRYFSTLQDLREETGEMNTSSDDENYSENCLPKVPKKIKRQVNHDVSNSGVTCITSTTSYPLNFPGSNYFLNHFVEMFEVSEERYRDMLITHKEKIVLDPKRPELAITHIDLKGINSRCNLPKRSSNKIENAGKKKIKLEISDKSANASMHDSGENESSLSFANILIKDESPDSLIDFIPPTVQETEVQTDPLTPMDEGEDSQMCDNQLMRLPSPRSEIQQYPTCFFALLRDIFCDSTEHKLSTVKLEEKVRNWQEGPTASLFEWLNFQESWPELVSSALKFLAGDLISILPDTFVPFLDYKEKQQQWQWIGSGRDSDEQMYGLCQQWLESKDDVSLDILETSQGSPPPPRVTTGWTVRPTAENEKQLYRQQECIRYQNPHKAFTFKVHGYEAVVGPVKGVYGKESGINKAREHSLLTSDRPPFVTILSLVRDSAARLPNGEGTRADICELLKDSQYLAAASDQQIHTVVSGALDRLHYEKDPCVKYDVNRKLWIYLHRHRTEEEFERIHQAQAAAAKARKAIQKNKLPKIQKSKEITRTLTSIVTTNSDNIATLNVDIPTSVSSGSSSQSPRGGSSPRTQGSPKSSQSSNRFIIHPVTSPSQTDVKPVISGENQFKSTEIVIKKEIDLPSPLNTPIIDVKPILPVTVSTPIQEFNISRQSSSASIYSFATTKSVIGNLNATQIVSVTPIQIKPCAADQAKPIATLSSHVHDVLNVDMKPSSPSFVGQPPVLQPVISHQVNEKTNPSGGISNSVSPTLLSAPPVTKTKVNCAALSGLQTTTIAGFQTIVIKQEPGLRSCNSVSAIPLLSIEERLPSTNPSAINAGPVVARLVHGSQYLSFSNILASSNACSSNKPISGTVQNFRVHGGNICQQMLSTSTIKVMHSTPVSAITESRFPVIQLKNQSNIKEASVITQSPTSLNVCGRLYQMTNIRNAVISKATDNKSSSTATKESCESTEKETKDNNSISLPSTAYTTPLSLSNRSTQPVIKVCPK